MGLAFFFVLLLCVSALELSLTNLSSTAQLFNFVSVGCFPNPKLFVMNNSSGFVCNQETLGVSTLSFPFVNATALVAAEWFSDVVGDEILFFDRSGYITATDLSRNRKLNLQILPLLNPAATPFAIVVANFLNTSSPSAILVGRSTLTFVTGNGLNLSTPLAVHIDDLFFAVSSQAGMFDGNDALSDLVIVLNVLQGL